MVEEQIAQQNAKYAEQLRFMEIEVKENIPDKLKSYVDELDLWKRWFTRIQGEFDRLV